MAIKTNRKPLRGNRRSHSMHSTPHFQKVNKQKATINGVKQERTVKEMRTLKKSNEKAA